MPKWCSLLMLCLAGCGLFEDHYKPNTPKPVNTTFRYPGILEIVLVCRRGDADTNTTAATNSLVITNVGIVDATDLEIVIDVFSGPNKTFNELLRRERIQNISPIPAGSQDTISLTQTNDFISNSANIVLSVVKLQNASANPLSGYYDGSFISYSDGEPIYGGNMNTIVDIHGNIYSNLQGENEFNTVSGTVTPDSSLFATLRKESENIKKVQIKFSSTEPGVLKCNYVLQTDNVDSTVTQLFKN